MLHANMLDQCIARLQDGVEVPPEEEIIKEEPLDILEELRDDDIEDLSYATMFANALQLENRTQASEAMPMNDPIVERPTPYLVRQKPRYVHFCPLQSL